MKTQKTMVDKTAQNSPTEFRPESVMNADHRMAVTRTQSESATLAPRIFICMRLSLAGPLQAFSISILSLLGWETCETMDFHPFFRINLQPSLRKKRGDNVLCVIASLFDQTALS
jgi:hypothetical protein